MRIDRLTLKNIRCYEDVHFAFSPELNLIVGENGAGKTALLNGLAVAMRKISRQIYYHGGQTMKNKKMSGLLSGIALSAALSCLTGDQQAFAFSGPDITAPPAAVHMTTEVTNLSGATVAVELYAKSLTGTTSRYSEFSISHGEIRSAKFLSVVAGLCPSYLTGKVGNAVISQTSCSGAESSSTTERCCTNLKFNVIKKQDGTYHFQKVQ